MDLTRRGSVKSEMLKSFFGSNGTSSKSKVSTCETSYKSSKRVVTSSGSSKVAVYETEAKGKVTSETIGGETTTESDFTGAERYAEIENEEGDDDIKQDLAALMSKDFENMMNTPLHLMLGDEEEKTTNETEAIACSNPCPFGICAEGLPCQCLDDCEVDIEGGATADTIVVTQQLENTTLDD